MGGTKPTETSKVHESKPRRRRLLNAAPWFLAGMGLIGPLTVALFFKAEDQIPAAIGMVAALTCTIVAAAIILRMRRDPSAVISRAQDFIRETVRAPFMLLMGCILGGIFASSVMLVALLLSTSPQHSEHTTQSRGSEQSAGLAASPAPGSTVDEAQREPATPHLYPWREQYPTAFVAMLSGFATVLVVGVFYRRLAPYIDIWELADEIEADIKRVIERGSGEVWWVFPGFGLGQYRSQSDAVHRGRYDRFRKSIESVITNEDIPVRAIIYNPHCLLAFYAAYHCQKLKGANSAKSVTVDDMLPFASADIVKSCVEGEELIVGLAAAPNRGNAIYLAKRPDILPNTVIVIGDVVYQIAAYGAPIFMARTEELSHEPFRSICGIFAPMPPADDDPLVELIVFRRQDASFAKAVAAHLQVHAEHALAGGLVEKKG